MHALRESITLEILGFLREIINCREWFKAIGGYGSGGVLLAQYMEI